MSDPTLVGDPHTYLGRIAEDVEKGITSPYVLAARALELLETAGVRNVALRWALADLVAFSAFLASCVRSGERMTDEDERMLAELQRKARAVIATPEEPR